MGNSKVRTIAVVGGGFGGLSAACYLAQAGHRVTLFEKNSQLGGRAIVTRTAAGSGEFVFDMGPSWYMMPDVFDEFFADFGKKTSDFYELKKLDPSYKVFFEHESFDVHSAPKVFELFEKLEKGSSQSLRRLLEKTNYEYDLVREKLLSSPMTSFGELDKATLARLLTKPELLGSYHARIQKYVSDPRLQKILEFMVVFMGGSPKNIPALYSLLAHVDMNLGIWYPMGGMGAVVSAFEKLARDNGVTIQLDAEVTRIYPDGLEVHNHKEKFDIVVANADYHHVETELLGEHRRKWDKKVLSPSGLLIYLGLDKKLRNIRHHNLLFDVDWDQHFHDVFDTKVWSDQPMVYVGAPSVTDPRVAPQGKENLFILAPMANGSQPDDETIAKTVDSILSRLESAWDESIREHIIYKDVKAHSYFEQMFHAYKGNAFGLAHTLRQSAVLRPPIRHKKIPSLYFVGQYTNPGTGVPIVVLGGKVVAHTIIADIARKRAG